MDNTAIRNEVRATFNDEFVPEKDPAGTKWPPAFKHAPTGHRFRYIPGGEFHMGFSEHEERAAKALCDPIPANVSEMRPVTLTRVAPFLITELPVLAKEVEEDLSEHPTAAAYVTWERAAGYAHQLGMSLPREFQWEYACRARTTTLFTWGDALPDDDELARWLAFDFGDERAKANGFGLRGLFVGEWCTDFFTPEAKVRVVRGGGAYFWPWQDQEWVWCMSAMRAPGTDLPHGECGFRLLKSFP